jgi:hypothetical protein
MLYLLKIDASALMDYDLYRYVKSTVCRHRGVWRRADDSIRREFEAMGGEEGAMWGEFVRRVEGKPPGKFGSGERAQFRNNGTLEDGILSPRRDKGQAEAAMASLAPSTNANMNSMASSLQGGTLFITFKCQVMFFINNYMVCRDHAGNRITEPSV